MSLLFMLLCICLALLIETEITAAFSIHQSRVLARRLPTRQHRRQEEEVSPFAIQEKQHKAARVQWLKTEQMNRSTRLRL